MKARFAAMLAVLWLCVCGAALADSEGNAVDLYLPCDPEAGSWEYVIENEDLVEVTDQFYEDIHELGLIGTDGVNWVHLEGLEPGTTALRMLLINSQTLKTDLTLVYRLTVDEDLNILIWGFEMLEAERSPRGAIQSFFFWTGGYENPRSYSLRRNEAGLMLKERDSEGETEASGAFLADFASLVEKYDVVAWDGFDEAAEGVLDGDNFLLALVWENGFSIQATGSNAFPEHYDDFRQEVERLFLFGE